MIDKKEMQRLEDLATEVVGLNVLDVAFSDGPLQKINLLGWMRKLAPERTELAEMDPREGLKLLDYLLERGYVSLGEGGWYAQG